MNTKNITPFYPSKLVHEMQLTDKQRALVDTLVAEDVTIKEAALKAGYSPGKDGESARVNGSRTLRLGHVQQYYLKCVQDALTQGSAAAVRTLSHLNDAAKSEYVKMQAATAILDRAGFAKRDQSVHISSNELTVNIDLS